MVDKENDMLYYTVMTLLMGLIAFLIYVWFIHPIITYETQEEESRFYEIELPELNFHQKNQSIYKIIPVDGKFYFLNCVNSTLKFDEDSIWCETNTTQFSGGANK